MSGDNPHGELELLNRIDRICDQFEDALNQGLSPQVEEFVTQMAVTDRTVLQRHLEDLQEAWQHRSADSAEFPTSPRFQFRRLLGAGAFGRVFLAYDQMLDRLVAIKMPHVRPDLQNGAANPAETALAEARRVAQLDHPAIVPVLDVLRIDAGTIWVVSKYVEGESLSGRLTRGPMPVAEAIDLTSKIAEALHQAHLLGIVHRDVKPSNIILDPNGEPHLLDFGLAAPVGQPGREDRGFTGTLPYLPPEALKGTADADPRLDIYALGVILYQLLTGTRPFSGDTATMTVAIETAAPPSIRAQMPEVSGQLEATCLRAISRDPAARQATAAEFANDLRRCRATPIRFSRRHWLAAAGLGLGAAGLAAWLLQPRLHWTVVEALPSGTSLEFVPLDTTVAARHVLTAGQRLRLPPGDYRVFARKDGAFHEVIRHVPWDPRELANGMKHGFWIVLKNGDIQLPEIKLHPADAFPTMLESREAGLPAFKIDRQLVTIREYKAMMGLLPVLLRQEKNLDENKPVTRLTYDDAVVFAETCGRRLPSVAELDRLAATNALPSALSHGFQIWTSSPSQEQGEILRRVWHATERENSSPQTATYSTRRQSMHKQLGICLARSVEPRVTLS